MAEGIQAKSTEPPPRAARKVWIAVALLAAFAIATVVWTRHADKGDAKVLGPRPAAPVVAIEAKAKPLTVRDSYRGELDADVAELTSQSSGYVVEVRVAIGDTVHEGDELARIDATHRERDVAEGQAALASARAEITRTNARLHAAETENARGETSFDKGLISEQQAVALKTEVELRRAEVQAAEASLLQAQARISSLTEVLRDTTIRAPFDGSVAARHVDPGAVVPSGAPVLRLVRDGALRVRFRISEQALPRVAVGLPFDVTVRAAGEKTFSGKVTRLASEVSRINRTIAVEGQLDAIYPELRPGMYADISLTRESFKNVVAVPSIAIVSQLTKAGLKEGVFVARDGTANFIPVETLGASGDETAVKGLDAGAMVITVGQGRLRDKSPIRVSDDGEKGAAP